MRVEHLAILPQGIFILLACAEADAVCPQCQHRSSRVASRYVRNIEDLPWRQLPMVLRLTVRRFFCDRADCPRKVFAEQFPQIARKHGRRTVDQEKRLAQIGLACGGQAGARLAQADLIHASGDTVLRCLRRHATTPSDVFSPRIVGIDDFAFRKGCRYGTLLVDHESGKVLDLLDQRSSESTAAMLARYPNVQTVTRDRSNLFANGIKAAHPHAMQIADRFHLHMNLDAAVERLLGRHRAEIARAAVAASAPKAVAVTEAAPPPPTVPASMRARYQQAMDLRKQGRTIRAIRKETKLHPLTIIKYLRMGGFPSRLERKSRRKRAGRMSPRRASLLMLYDKAQPKPGEKKIIELLREQSPSLVESIDLARRCSTILQERNSGKLLEWIEQAKQPQVPKELQNYAKGLELEWSSIKPAMDLPWSNARAEGHVNRIKLIKRSMYGRGNIDLLRLRATARSP